jgi:hypothetical protein
MRPNLEGQEQAPEALKHTLYVTVAGLGTTTLTFNGSTTGPALR